MRLESGIDRKFLPVENHVEIASGRLGALSRKGFLPAVRIRPTAARTSEKFRPPIVDFGDKSRESAPGRDLPQVKLLASVPEHNKPRLGQSYYLQQALFK